MVESTRLRKWVERVRDKDGRAWANVYEEFRPNVFAAARRAGLNDADAEDVVQHVLGLTRLAISGAASRNALKRAVARLRAVAHADDTPAT